MTLPFEEKSKSRKYQCFVCGKNYLQFDEFTSHIKETHEEGRDFIVCPLAHCQGCVRDMRAHFKAKHSSIPIPEKGMMRSIVWKDFSPKDKKKKKPKFREGYYQSTKMNKSLHYRSGYECTIYECLDSDPEVSAFSEEPFEIPYIHKGKQRKYIPDLIVNYYNGRTEVWEIKPSSQTTLEKNQDKWYAAASACKNRGWEFIVITETGIDKLKNKLKKY